MEPNTNVTDLPDNNISSGYIELDRITGGWRSADLVIIGGRPSMGKTAFMTSMALKMALEYEYGVVLFSLEMSAQQLANRMLKSEVELDLRDENLELQQEQLEALNAVKDKLKNAPIFIDDTPAICAQDFHAKCKELALQHGIRAVFIDYLQLMTWNTKLSRNQEVSNILRSLKNTAKELNITIFVLSQLNREVEKRDGQMLKRPRLSELRDIDMKDIEQNVDTVLLIHRPEYYGFDEDENSNSLIGVAEIIVAKNRSGTVGDIRLSFSKKFAKFAETNKYINENFDEIMQDFQELDCGTFGFFGQAGELLWTFDLGVLTISGDGEIPDYDDYLDSDSAGSTTDEGRSPWYPFRNEIKQIIFKGNISKKGVYAFSGCENLTSVTFEDCSVPHFPDGNLNVKDIIDRALQGYTHVDLWNINSWFSLQVMRMLQEFRRKSAGIPMGMSPQDWYSIIERMIFCFSEMTKPFGTIKENKEMKEYRERMKKEGFELFCKYFGNLWW